MPSARSGGPTSGVVMGTAQDMRAAAEALDRMKAGMVAAHCAKSGRYDAEIEALMAVETWLSAQEAHALGLADRVEQPIRMAAHFDLSRFRHPPPQLAAIAATTTPQEDEMSDPQQKKPRSPDPDAAPAQIAAAIETDNASEPDAPAGSEPAEGGAVVPAAEPPPVPARAAAPAAQPTAQVIDLDAVRAEERRATLAYVAEVHELCAIAGRGEFAAQVRRALLEARAAEDEATAIRSQLRPAVTEPAQPTIDTAAIYAARNQHCR
jgi:ATP-dependent Clp protease, protease subunit